MQVEQTFEGSALRTREDLPLPLNAIGHVSFLAIDLLTNMILVCPRYLLSLLHISCLTTEPGSKVNRLWIVWNHSRRVVAIPMLLFVALVGGLIPLNPLTPPHCCPNT